MAAGFRRAFGNPPSPLRGPLPPDKQWGAREYIGARHPPLDRGGQGRSADFWLPAAGCWILASGVPSAIPPSPLRGPLPPDKQWGAREYIGARHPVSFGVGRSNGVRALAKKRAFPFEVAKGLLTFERKQTQSSPAGGYVPCPQKKTAAAVFFSYQHSRSSSTGQWSLPRISEWMEAPLMWSFHTLETRK